tara:strand:+ start:631 stop:1305 length:675 start_codon:yes stop_codon:yes gene_type:complete
LVGHLADTFAYRRGAGAPASEAVTSSTMSPNVLVIACGAIAHEVMALKRANGWGHMKVQCLPADLHNRPERITPAVEAKLDQLADKFDQVFVAYADCGTGGLLDALLEERGIERITGAHCYEFFAGAQQFADLSDEEPGTLYLTDFLARNFERLLIRGLGIEKHPELESLYFGNYSRVVYLEQRPNPECEASARAAAERLGLTFEHRRTGFGQLEVSLTHAARV